MLTGIRNDGKKVYAEEESKKDGYKYYCPECNQELILKQGTIKIWHFAHKIKNNKCLFGKYDNESPQHKLMKKTIKEIIEKDNQCLKSELEYKIGSRIADYYFEIFDQWGNCRKIAVECVYKHTNIDVFREKNEHYVTQNVYVIWLFDISVFAYSNNQFKREIRINEIIKESHTMYFGKVYAIDVNHNTIYGVHLDGVSRISDTYEYIDWSEWDPNRYQENYVEEHTYVCGGHEYYLSKTKKPIPFLFDKFIINAFKKAKTDQYLPYNRNVANMYVKKWW